MHGVITTLYGTAPGEVWKKEDVLALKEQVEDAGLSVDGIESVNVHDAIKAGLTQRDMYIDHYIETLKVLGEAGIVWYAITLCRCLTGHARSLPGNGRTALRYWPIPSRRWIALIRRKCSIPLRGI